MEVEFIFMDGIGNLYNETIRNQISLAQESGEQVVVLVYADTIAKGFEKAKRKKEMDNGMEVHELSFPYFLYPNNQNDGNVEELMENAARCDLHPIIILLFYVMLSVGDMTVTNNFFLNYRNICRDMKRQNDTSYALTSIST